MGCFGDHEKGELEDSQKWAYVTLSDFKASGALAYFSYAWLWFLAIVAVAVYGADTFTAVNLLAYDKWSSQIEPAIPLKYSKWIFAACIFFSWALCGFEWLRAIRVIRRGSVAESYMDPLAVTLQSMRPQGWKRFLVFAELTKSKKGVDYIALFVYFSFQGALRVIIAEAPRQVINGITLYSVMQADLVPTGDHSATDGRSSIEQFFMNIETLAETNREQAVVLFTMLFTLVIWVISALSLFAALIFYLTFLWHYIPQQDGRLSIYCKRKIDRRLSKIVGAKVKQALEDQEKQRMREEAKASKASGKKPGQPRPIRQPTLPQISGATPRLGDDKLPDFKLARQDSEATLPSYSSQPPSIRDGNAGVARKPTLPREPTLPDLGRPDVRPGLPSRSATEASNTSYSSDAPLLNNATGMGYDDGQHGYPADPRPVLDRQGSSAYGSRPVPDRQMSSSTYRSRPGAERQMSYSVNGQRQGPDRQMSSSAYGSRPPPNRQMSSSTQGSRPILDREDSTSSYGPTVASNRQMSASPYGATPDRQMSSTPYSQTSGPDRLAPASPYGIRPVPDRQMSSSTYMSKATPIRSMTPLSEVSTLVSSTPGYLNNVSHPHDQYRSSTAPGELEARSQTNYTPVHRTVSPLPMEAERQQANYTPVYGLNSLQDTTRSISPVETLPFQRQDTQNFHRPFSPPTNAPNFAQRHDTNDAGEAFEMITRPTTAPSASSNPTFAPNGGYVPFNPLYSAAPEMPRRNLTNPANAPSIETRFIAQRSATAPPEANAYEDIIDDYGRNRESDVPVRRATAGPGGYGHDRW